MKKFDTTSIFGIFGALSWALTNLLRETTINSLEIFNFILGIMPNIAATYFFIWVGKIIFERLNKNFTLKFSMITSALVFLFAIISEIIHDLFLNSPFDMYDMIATSSAIALYLITFYTTKNHRNISEQSSLFKNISSN